jgi:SAM-dependent methyltransferase
MTVFGAYADFYDALYSDKDYPAECDFLEEIFQQHASNHVRTILDMGCGTGGHALQMARRGFEVTGVDRSGPMLSVARTKAASLKIDHIPVFREGDARTLDLATKFDVVMSMFAVISYMTANEDLMGALNSARKHLNAGGLFVFDAWYGPAVLADRPTDRFKIVESDGERILRFVRPEIDPFRHVVNVHYKVLRIKEREVVEEVEEMHPMRFLFPQEIISYLGSAGFRVLRICPFMRISENIGERDWNMAVVAEAKVLN